MGEYNELDEEELEELRQENKELKGEIEKLKNFNASLIRQIKERANASKGQFPKKQHTGYSLVSSIQKEYRYYKEGNHKTALIFETAFQTPYDISLEYESVIDAVLDDLFKTDESGESIVEKLGFSGYYPDRSYADFYEDRIKEIKYELIEEYRKTHVYHSVPEEDLKKIREYAENDVRTSFYNLNVRMSGKDGYWNVSFNHIEPLASIPPELRFPVKRKKEKQKKEK